jgi:hypothetical protein
VEFQPGATSATRSGDLPAGGIKEYVLRASAGQMMHVQTVGQSAPIYFTLRSPGGTIWSGEPQPSDVYIFTVQVILPESGDYVVKLSVPQDTRATRYDVGFTIAGSSSPPDPPPVESPQRVNFAPGTTSATRSGDLPAGGSKKYVLWATAGQSMHVQTVGYNARVEFTLTSPAGATWTSEQQASDVNISTAEVILPQNGDYWVRLLVPPGTQATRYEIIFTVETGSWSTIPSPAEPPEAVSFASGATSAQRSGTLPSGPALKQYALAGKAGQTLTVELDNVDVSISISFTTPSGMTGFRSGHKFMLDETGIYIVTLSKTGETPSTDYTVVFTIQ